MISPPPPPPPPKKKKNCWRGRGRGPDHRLLEQHQLCLQVTYSIAEAINFFIPHNPKLHVMKSHLFIMFYYLCYTCTYNGWSADERRFLSKSDYGYCTHACHCSFTTFTKYHIHIYFGNLHSIWFSVGDQK